MVEEDEEAISIVSVFYMFGVAVQIVLVLFAIWGIRKVIRFVKRSKKWGRDYEALLWARAVVDPDGPRRIRQADIYRYRFNKKAKPVYTGKHPKLHKTKKWFIAITIILIALILITFNLSAIRGIFNPTVIETKTEISVVSVLNLVKAPGQVIGQYYDLNGTNRQEQIHQEDQASMVLQIHRTDTASESRNIDMTVLSTTFDTDGTPYVYMVGFLINGTGLMQFPSSGLDNKTFTLPYMIAQGETLRVEITIFFRAFPNLDKSEYLIFQTTGAPSSSVIHVAGGPSVPLPIPLVSRLVSR